MTTTKKPSSLWNKISQHPAVLEFYEDASNRQWISFRDSMGRQRIRQQKDFWVYLRDGWTNPHLSCGVIHEPTLGEVWNQLQRVVQIQK